MQFGGMQLLTQYKTKLDPKFLVWYEKNFNGSRLIYCHWPVENCSADDTHYHKVVEFEPPHAARVCNNEQSTVDMFDHTYHRNSNACAIALAGFAGADTTDLGSQCAHPEQVKAMVQCIADVCCNLRSPVGNVMSHGEAADNVDISGDPKTPCDDPYTAYGPLTTCERWDLWCWVDPETCELYPPKHSKLGTSWLLLPDFLRGEAIMEIQKRTHKAWS